MSSFVAGLFFGLKAAVLAVVIEAVLRVGRRALKSQLAVVIAAVAFVALFFFAVPFPLVVLAAAIIGFAADRLGYAMGGHAAHGKQDDDLLGEHIPDHAQPSLARAIKVVAIWLPLWLGPVALLFLFLGGDNIFTRLRCSSAKSRYSASAALMRCWPMSRNRRSRPITGCAPARC